MFDFLSKLGAPDEVQSQFGQLVDQFGPPPESVVNDLSTLSQRQKSGVGGGMFDAYSESNQGNLKMAMLVDIIGKLGGRDVGAMKTMMPLAENARKLRLQGVEAQQLQQMRESSQGLIDEYSSAPQGASGAAPARSPLSRLQRAQLQNALRSKDPGAVAKMLYEFGNRQFTRDAAQVRQLTPEEVSASGLDPNKQWQVDGKGKKSQIGSGVNVETNVRTGPNYPEMMGYEEMSAANLSQSKLAEGAASKLATHGRMLDVLTATKKDEHGNAVTDSYGNPVYVTDVGAMSKATLPFRNLYNSAVEELGGAEGLKKIGLSPATLQFVFESDNKDLALLAAALMKGNLSEKELDFSVDLFAKLGYTREANIILTKVGMMKEQGVIARNKHMNEWELNQAKSGVTSAYTLNLLRKTELESFNRTLRKNNGYRMQAVWYENDKNFTMSEEAIDFMYKEKGGSYAQ